MKRTASKVEGDVLSDVFEPHEAQYIVIGEVKVGLEWLDGLFGVEIWRGVQGVRKGNVVSRWIEKARWRGRKAEKTYIYCGVGANLDRQCTRLLDKDLGLGAGVSVDDLNLLVGLSLQLHRVGTDKSRQLLMLLSFGSLGGDDLLDDGSFRSCWRGHTSQKYVFNNWSCGWGTMGEFEASERGRKKLAMTKK